MKPTVLERLRSRVAVDEQTGCWVWTGCISGGYGHVRHKGKVDRAHRVAYEIFIGPIPPGLDLDHVECQRTLCINPFHTEPVTRAENVSRMRALLPRKLVCPKGHQKINGRCRECNRQATLRYSRARGAQPRPLKRGVATCD